MVNDPQVGDILVHRTLTIKSPFAHRHFAATFTIIAIDGERIRIQQDHDVSYIGVKHCLLRTELPAPHGESFDIKREVMDDLYINMGSLDSQVALEKSLFEAREETPTGPDWARRPVQWGDDH